MIEPETIWVKSKWKVEELEKQQIEFRLRSSTGDIVSGVGEIWARSRSRVDDLLDIQIVVEQPEGRWKVRQTLFPLSQTSADYIALHPDQKIARFQLVMP